MIRKINRLIILGVLVLIVLLTYGCGKSGIQSGGGGDTQGSRTADGGGVMTVHFIDVGQADCILIMTPGGRVLLIDAGNNGDDETVINYLRNRQVSRIDYLVGTHPHEDHIGSLDKVIENFDIGMFYMPRVTSTTKTFKDVINAARNKGLDVNVARSGVEFDMDSGIKAFMLAPMEDKYDDLNDYSAVIKLEYNDISFLLTGDAAKVSEKQMLEQGLDLSAYVLKVGHHGSSTSSTEAFLDAVNPEYAVISVGAGNDYRHPDPSTISRLEDRGIKVYRTDESGTVVISTDGKDISINK